MRIVRSPFAAYTRVCRGACGCKRTIGWEKFGGESFLRMALNEPRLGTVWPGSPSASKPHGEQRKLMDEVLPLADVGCAAGDAAFAEERGYSARDRRLMRQAWVLRPGHGAEARAAAKHEPRGPDLF